MHWTSSFPSPGARTSPPRATRTGQYVNRSVGSPGPTISPGRTFATRPGQPSSAAFSHSAFSGPYDASVTFSTVGSASVPTGVLSSMVPGDEPYVGYTLIVDTRV